MPITIPITRDITEAADNMNAGYRMLLVCIDAYQLNTC